MSVPYYLGSDSINSHAFNGDRSQLALSLNNNNVYLLKVPIVNGGSYQLVDILKAHSALVTGIDWAPKTNCIVSCSADRNAYVWVQENNGKWKPTLVLLMIDRAALCVKWSPMEDRFAIGSGSKLLSICYFEKEFNWWISKKICKPIRSSVTCVDWHPNNVLVACGSSDFHVRIYSVYVDSGDNKSVWGEHSSLGTILFDHYDGEGGWVLSVSFSLEGNKLAWVKHNSCIYVADATNGNPAVVSYLRSEFLPFATCTWIGLSTFVAGGYDCCPMVFTYSNKEIKYVNQLDIKDESKTSVKMTAMKKFQDIDRMATVDNSSSRLNTVHQNCINEIRVFSTSCGIASKLSSVGRDGNLVLWDLPTLCDRISDLKIC